MDRRAVGKLAAALQDSRKLNGRMSQSVTATMKEYRQFADAAYELSDIMQSARDRDLDAAAKSLDAAAQRAESVLETSRNAMNDVYSALFDVQKELANYFGIEARDGSDVIKALRRM